MDAETIRAVRASWNEVIQKAPDAGALFYERLFAADPGLRSMFPDDVNQQAPKLVQMLAVAINKLDEPAVLSPALRELGKRHASYGVMPQHYEVVGSVLLETLGVALGDHLTQEMRAAWLRTYAAVSEAMQDGAKEPKPNASPLSSLPTAKPEAGEGAAATGGGGGR